MKILSAIFGVVLILVVLGDAFETVILSRRVTRRVRLARLFFRYTWLPCAALFRRISSGERRENYLSYYGPLSLLFLLMLWAAGLIFGFALIHWASGSALNLMGGAPGFLTDIYYSGTNFFTLGLGDITPPHPDREGADHSGSGRGLRFPGPDNRLSSRTQSFFLPAGGQYFAVGCARRLASHRSRTPAAA